MFKSNTNLYAVRLAAGLGCLLSLAFARAGAAQSAKGFFGALPANVSYPDDNVCSAEIATTPETVVNMPISDCTGSYNSTSNNRPFNANVPSATQLASYAANGYTFDSYPDAQFARIDGQYPTVLGATPSTDMILRYGACKFGLDEDVMRAEAMEESGWVQGTSGDLGYGGGSCVQGGFTSLYNQAIREPDGNVMPVIPNGCCESWSILQTKVYYEWMTWPMIMKDTSFAVEHLGAEIRTCMDGGYQEYMNAAYWRDYNKYLSNPSGYNSNLPNYFHGTNQSLIKNNTNRMLWGCVGTHYAGYDWYDAISNPYIYAVQQQLHQRAWPK